MISALACPPVPSPARSFSEVVGNWVNPPCQPGPYPEGHACFEYDIRRAILHENPFPDCEFITVGTVRVRRQSFIYLQPEHWWWGLYPLAVTVYLPDNPNGCGIVGMVSSGFGSQGNFTKTLEERLEDTGLLTDFLSRGFAVFQVRHGSKTRARQPNTMKLPVPGFLASEIFEHVDAAIRWIKCNRVAFGLAPGAVNAEDLDQCLGATGGSSGAYLALRALVGSPSSGPLPMDASDFGTKVAAAAVKAPSADVLDLRFENDPSWMWRNPEMFINPRFERLAEFSGPGYPSAPTNAYQIYHSDFFEDTTFGPGHVPNYQVFPEINFLDSNPCELIRPANENYPTSRITFPEPTLEYPPLPASIATLASDSYSINRLITPSTGKSVIISGRDDPITPLNSAARWLEDCNGMGVGCTHIVVDTDAHTFFDSDLEQTKIFARFFANELDYANYTNAADADGDRVPDSHDSPLDYGLSWDTDGDGENDFEEYLMDTGSSGPSWITDPEMTFKITSMTYSSTPASNPQVTLQFDGSAGSYHLQESTDATTWSDVATPTSVTIVGATGSGSMSHSWAPTGRSSYFLRVVREANTVPLPIAMATGDRGLSEAATNPVCIVPMEVRRRANETTVNFLTAPVQQPPVFQGRLSTITQATPSGIEATLTFAAPLPAALASNFSAWDPTTATSLEDRPGFYAVIARDDSSDLFGQEANAPLVEYANTRLGRLPEHEGLEGHWFSIKNVASHPSSGSLVNSVVIEVKPHHQSSIIEMISLGAENFVVALKPLPTLVEIVSDENNPALRDGDKIRTFVEPNPVTIGSWLEALTFSGSTSRWISPAMTSVFAADIRLYPGEVIRYEAVASTNSLDLYAVFGHAATNRINAYLPELNSMRGWCFPRKSRLHAPNGTSGGYWSSGFLSTLLNPEEDLLSSGDTESLTVCVSSNPPCAHDKGIFLPFVLPYFSTTNPPGLYAGDDFGEWVFATPERAKAGDCRYWERPAEVLWYLNKESLMAFQSQSYLSPVAPRDVPEATDVLLEPGRGYAILRFTSMDDALLWRRWLPYPRP